MVYESQPASPGIAAPTSEMPPKVKTAPTTAPGKKVAQAASVVGMPPVWPVGPIVSIIEKPHGDQVPVAPIRRPATTRAMMTPGVHHPCHR